ncbi:MAG: hypothetical protein LBS79_02780 [Tannerella sp.]|jgi:hypothetical protein|nr:hypothetical protein [Tannerella sp.]
MDSLLEQTDVVRRKGLYWRKMMNVILIVVLSGFVVLGAIRYYYPYAEGVKSGNLDHVVYKGLVFKTYEGKLIQPGIRSSESGDIQSNEFGFSVAKKNIAEKLMRAGGKSVELHYTEYFGTIPWRGDSRYIVDEIVSISDEKEVLDMDDAVVNVVRANP